MNPNYSIDWLKDQCSNGISKKILFFWGHNHKPNEPINKFCLSQWFESSFMINDVSYKTAEHWMMAQKALLFNDLDCYQAIMDATHPHEAKRIGRMVTGFSEKVWNEKRYEIVVKGNYYKFKQSPELSRFLINTKQRVIVEASPVDKIWGIGLAKENDKAKNVFDWNGLNFLGFALMEVRDMLGKEV